MNRSALSFGSNRFVEARDCMSAETVVAWPATAIADELWVPFLIIALWVIMEIAFVILLNYILLPNLHKLKPPVPYHGDIVVMMKRTLDQVDILKSYTFEKFVEGFCNAAKFEDVRIDNFRSFMSWLMYHKHLHDLSWEERDKLEYMVQYAAEKHPKALELKDGHNSIITHCRMTLEPLPVIHRPLILYLMANLVEAISNVLFLQSAGFQRLELDGMKYWYKEQGNRQHENQGPNTSDGTEPMVFMHGISTGWMVYLPMVKVMGSGRTMILLDLDAVKIKSLSFDMPTPEQYVDRVNRILKRHSIARASVVGHSFGSITAGWLVRYHPEKVSHLTLVDPVSLLLGLPNVAYSFLYRKPSTLIEWVIHVTAARELTISYSLRRHFWWYNNNLWLEDVPSHIGIVVGVSSNDEIISGAAVFEYTQNCQAARVQQRARIAQQATAEESPRRVTRSQYQREQIKADAQCSNKRERVAGIECVLWEGFSHGQVLIPGEAQSKFIEMVHTNEKVGSC